MARRRRAFPAPIFDILRKVYPSPQDFQGTRAFAFWSKAMPARVQRNAQPVRLQRGVLWVHVSSPSWAQELSMMAPQLLRRLRSHAPSAGVRALRFRVGPLPQMPIDPGVEDPPLEAVVEQLPEELGRELAFIGDDRLRELVGRAALSSLRRSGRRHR